jgi:hypothetical protein
MTVQQIIGTGKVLKTEHSAALRVHSISVQPRAVLPGFSAFPNSRGDFPLTDVLSQIRIRVFLKWPRRIVFSQARKAKSTAVPAKERK